ncbi:Zinc finger RING-type [Penicillium capsulatum]|uniref:RING-type E3 ubiquitin transferase n=1 Tax=Penicillium capsulatum TaxID=69766 RepID=A0A9W9LRD0_9EURO|nr:Zinc finger RING-type [Penicillium capsulatum]KAJ6135775.1 Zinc finger RING-type [Penicillium capsulatum]
MIILFFCILLPLVHAVTVVPSNQTQDVGGSPAQFRLRGSGPLNGQPLAPLTTKLAHRKSFKLEGSLKKVIASDSRDLNHSQIACIPCDTEEYTGELSVDQTVRLVLTAQQSPAAVLLYSTSSARCNFSADGPPESLYHNVLTFTRSDAADALQRAFGDTQNTTTRSLTMSLVASGGSAGDGDGGGSSGDSPNTAMIILYSITGIITALFLGIIITGAVRAHRHPERYGPRRVAGRPRQSRARGIARAMLDTIPIVKYDDNRDQVDAAKRDIEMSLGPEDAAREHSPPRSENAADIAHATPHESELPTTEQHSDHHITAAPEAKNDAAPDAGNFSCPICTDDFVKGQDMRVLPCNHQFHPECIDPWLVNVSGTCPLCRIDLNPPKTEENAEQEGDQEHPEDTPVDGTANPAAETAPDATQGRHSRITTYLHGPLNARRMHNATVEERLAALRHVRETSQGDATLGENGTRPNRSRLTTRLRDRFRIRTRAHGEASSPDESGTSTPIPAPAPPAPGVGPGSSPPA